MEKLLLVTDLHLGVHKDNPIWIDITVLLFKEILDSLAKEDISTLVILGDFFDNRKALNVKTLVLSLYMADMLKNVNVFIIVGNHDTYYKNKIDPTSLEIFNKFKNITIVKSPITYGDILMVPWNTEFSQSGKFLFGHFEIANFLMNNKHKCKKGMDISEFGLFERVFSGHFHTPSVKDNIMYLGSAFPQTFHDVNSKRGYYIFNDGNVSFIEFTDAPKFVIIDTEEEQYDNIKGNIVKVVYKKDYGTENNNKILEKIQSFQPIQLFTDFSNISLEENEENKEEKYVITTSKDTVKNYIDSINIPQNLKKPVLLELMYRMMNEIGV